MNVKGRSGKKSGSGKENGGTARGKRSASGNGRGNESGNGRESETKTVTAGPGKRRQTELLKGEPSAADPGEAKILKIKLQTNM